MNARKQNLFWLTCMCVVLAIEGLYAASSESGQPSPQGTNQSLSVTARLRSGATVQALLAAAPLQLRTAYAEMIFDPQRVATIELNSSNALATVVTLNSNRISGFLGTSLELTSGSPAKRLARWDVERISVHHHLRIPIQPSDHWLKMRTGDMLSGHFTKGSAAFQLKDVKEPVSLSDVASWASIPSTAQFEVVTSDGRVTQGSPQTEEVEFVPGFGPAVRLPIGEIQAASSDPSTLNQARSKAGTVSGPPQELKSAVLRLFPDLVWVSPGTFQMGSRPEEAGHDSDESPITSVVIQQGFFMGKFEVTQARFQELMSINPSLNTGEPLRPVERITWYEAMAFCEKLSREAESMPGFPAGWAFRLPTEAEWEYACRAGTTTRFSYGDDKSDLQLGDYAWFTRNSESMTHPVGKKQPNPWGLYDMHGNVWEWCLDRWGGLLPGGTVTNAPAAAKGTLRAARGGSWLYEAKACRSANRDDYAAANRCGDVGFRVVLAPLELNE